MLFRSEKLQIAGMTCFADQIHAVGSAADGGVVAHCFKGDRFLGVEAVNRPGDYVTARKLLMAGRLPTRDDLERVGFDLRAYLDG